MKRNGTWETNQRRAGEEQERLALRRHLRDELRPEIRRQLTREFIQSGLVRITGPDQVNALIAGRNAWRGNKLLDELVGDFIAAGNPEAADAIREWQRLANQMSSRRTRNPPPPPPPASPLLGLDEKPL